MNKVTKNMQGGKPPVLGYEESPGWKIKYTIEGQKVTVHLMAIKMTIEGKIE